MHDNDFILFRYTGFQSVGMEWRFVDIIDRILTTAQEHGHPDKIYQFQMKIQENAQNYWDKIVCTPICLWSGCPPTLPFMLQAIMDMDDGCLLYTSPSPRDA